MTNKRVHVHCEGQIEETLVKTMLAPYLAGTGAFAYPVPAATKRGARKRFKGGIVSYEQVRHQLTRLCRQ